MREAASADHLAASETYVSWTASSIRALTALLPDAGRAVAGRRPSPGQHNTGGAHRLGPPDARLIASGAAIHA